MLFWSETIYDNGTYIQAHRDYCTGYMGWVQETGMTGILH